MTLCPETADISRILGVQFYKCLQFDFIHPINVTNYAPKSQTALSMLIASNNICCINK